MNAPAAAKKVIADAREAGMTVHVVERSEHAYEFVVINGSRRAAFRWVETSVFDGPLSGERGRIYSGVASKRAMRFAGETSIRQLRARVGLAI